MTVLARLFGCSSTSLLLKRTPRDYLEVHRRCEQHRWHTGRHSYKGARW